MNNRIRLKKRLIRNMLVESRNDIYNNFYFHNPEYLEDTIKRVGLLVWSENLKNGDFKIHMVDNRVGG